jgi:N-formylglutamate deformylase
MPIFNFIPATVTQVPLLVSVPHCGVTFPDELKDEFDPDLSKAPDDTDWFVDQLYDFVPSLGISMVTADYSRWVIDLNRDPDSKPLYTDGRIITALCPSTNFLGEPLYRDRRKEVAPAEVARRVKNYYVDYHQKIEDELGSLSKKFGKVLLWDCHSIRELVPTIQKEKFPDLILGDVEGTSAGKKFSDIALRNLKVSSYSVTHNHPFKGGYITRRFGKPLEQQHALQLEMTKVNYMDDPEKKYNPARANRMRLLLKETLEKLIIELNA